MPNTHNSKTKENGKLGLDWSLVDKARQSASVIAQDVQGFIDAHTTVSVERTVARLYGVDGIDKEGMPLPNVLIDAIVKRGDLSRGAAFYIAGATLAYGTSPAEIARAVAEKKLDITAAKHHSPADIRDKAVAMAREAVQTIRENRRTRERFIHDLGEGKKPFIYLIVATGNIYEDVIQARSAVELGADIVAVIRTTGQSLLDYVPYGATTEGIGGTYATQENFRIMRQALDEAGDKNGKYIRLCNYCSGLCMPEIAAMGALERLDVMLNDALYGILFRDINMQRTLIDQYFSRVINGFAGVIINTGEDNYLTTADAIEEAHTVLASQFINEQFALQAGLPEKQMGLGHAFEMDPATENGFLLELAQAQMAREIFPEAPLKYMPPTKFKTGNIFKGHIQDALFNAVSVITHQEIHLLGMLTEAIHTPFMADRALAIENARYIFNNMRDLGDEIVFKPGGIIQQRAHSVLTKTAAMLKEIRHAGLFATIEAGQFGGVKRARTGGKGLSGVVKKQAGYFNPFIDLMMGEGR